MTIHYEADDRGNEVDFYQVTDGDYRQVARLHREAIPNTDPRSDSDYRSSWDGDADVTEWAIANGFDVADARRVLAKLGPKDEGEQLIADLDATIPGRYAIDGTDRLGWDVILDERESDATKHILTFANGWAAHAARSARERYTTEMILLMREHYAGQMNITAESLIAPDFPFAIITFQFLMKWTPFIERNDTQAVEAIWAKHRARATQGNQDGYVTYSDYDVHVIKPLKPTSWTRKAATEDASQIVRAREKSKYD